MLKFITMVLNIHLTILIETLQFISRDTAIKKLLLYYLNTRKMKKINIFVEIISMNGNCVLRLVKENGKFKLLESVSDYEYLLYDFDFEKIKNFFNGVLTLSQMRSGLCYIYDIRDSSFNICVNLYKYYVENNYINQFTKCLDTDLDVIERVYKHPNNNRIYGMY